MGEFTQEFSSILTKEMEVNPDFFYVIGWVSGVWFNWVVTTKV